MESLLTYRRNRYHSSQYTSQNSQNNHPSIRQSNSYKIHYRYQCNWKYRNPNNYQNNRKNTRSHRNLNNYQYSRQNNRKNRTNYKNHNNADRTDPGHAEWLCCWCSDYLSGSVLPPRYAVLSIRC